MRTFTNTFIERFMNGLGMIQTHTSQCKKLPDGSAQVAHCAASNCAWVHQ